MADLTLPIGKVMLKYHNTENVRKFQKEVISLERE